jgi:hypothetical protein
VVLADSITELGGFPFLDDSLAPGRLPALTIALRHHEAARLGLAQEIPWETRADTMPSFAQRGHGDGSKTERISTGERRSQADRLGPDQRLDVGGERRLSPDRELRQGHDQGLGAGSVQVDPDRHLALVGLEDVP